GLAGAAPYRVRRPDRLLARAYQSCTTLARPCSVQVAGAILSRDSEWYWLTINYLRPDEQAGTV
ncbi:MAG TPA: hypothetical protein VE860_23250, partial [Chthoniobacterales bacterium]|nr:hypothetical protein [Chthoniobacterales bacterium]